MKERNKKIDIIVYKLSRNVTLHITDKTKKEKANSVVVEFGGLGTVLCRRWCVWWVTLGHTTTSGSDQRFREDGIN
jgi:hypothetical protein